MTSSKTSVKILAVVCVFVVAVNHLLPALMTIFVPINNKLSAVTPFQPQSPPFAQLQTNVLLLLVIHVERLEENVNSNLLTALASLELMAVPPTPVTLDLVNVLFQTLLLAHLVIVLMVPGLNGPSVETPVVLELKQDPETSIKLLSMVELPVPAVHLNPVPALSLVVQSPAKRLPGLNGAPTVLLVTLEPKPVPVPSPETLTVVLPLVDPSPTPETVLLASTPTAVVTT